MRDLKSFRILFYALIVMLAGSIFYNVFQGVELFGYKEFILIAFLIFLVIGDEFSSFTVRKDGVEIKNKVNNTK